MNASCNGRPIHLESRPRALATRAVSRADLPTQAKLRKLKRSESKRVSPSRSPPSSPLNRPDAPVATETQYELRSHSRRSTRCILERDRSVKAGQPRTTPHRSHRRTRTTTTANAQVTARRDRDESYGPTPGGPVMSAAGGHHASHLDRRDFSITPPAGQAS
jgi:hypothetical protein